MTRGTMVLRNLAEYGAPIIDRILPPPRVVVRRPAWLIEDLLRAAEEKRARRCARRLRERVAGGWTE